MENLEKYKVIIYLLIGALYLIFKNRKKKAPEVPAQKMKKQTSQSLPKNRTLINKGRDVVKTDKSTMVENPSTLEAAGTAQIAQQVDYDDNVTDEEGKYVVPRMKDSEKEMKDKFGPYSDGKGNENEYSQLLKNPDSLKKVIVMNEILTPKHI